MPEEEDLEILTTGTALSMNLDSEYRKYLLEAGSLISREGKDPVSLIYGMVDANNITLKALQELERSNKKEALTATLEDNFVIGIEEGDSSQSLYGLAIDVGTTTVVIYLMDLITGQEVDCASFYNPQKKFGGDVISRINYTLENKDGTDLLHKTLLAGLNEEIAKLLYENNIRIQDILKTVVVGNTVMLHMLLGFPTISLARAPYTPVFTGPLSFTPQGIGLELPERGLAHLLPCVSAYVGADVIADMLACDFGSDEDFHLLVDIGTNGEVVLGRGKNILACSTAAGPAFEGATISSGMAGLPGAISGFRLQDEGMEIRTIKDKKPQGICGSGLLDLVAELRRTGFINKEGRLAAREKLSQTMGKRLVDRDGKPAFLVVRAEDTGHGKEILLTQKDIRQVQLAKGAIASGIEMLLQEMEVEADNISKVFIAGGFGNYMDPQQACYIGLLPDSLKNKIVPIGNAAGTGACMFLLNKELKKEVQKFQEKTQYLELARKPDFQEVFVRALSF